MTLGGGGERTTHPVAPRPLYAQIHARLVARLAEGEWQPGQMLPSEFELAAELGVSQGTVRKALDLMTAERLLVRRQGRGTFVAEIDDAHILFTFFKLNADNGPAAFPTSRVLAVSEASASAVERDRLGIGAEQPVVRIRRLRSLGDVVAVLETISVPGALFPRLADRTSLPNNLYGVYSTDYGIRICTAEERLKAVLLSERAARRLGVEAGHPALRVDRIARDLEHRAVEWRVSLCLTERLHYRLDLG